MIAQERDLAPYLVRLIGIVNEPTGQHPPRALTAMVAGNLCQ